MNNNPTYDQQFYDKVKKEFEAYRSWLLQQTPEEILNHTYEYTIKQDIISIMENDEGFSEEDAEILLKLESPLDVIYQEFNKIECGYMEILEETIYQLKEELKNEN